jgi:hypothetical protein
MVWMPRFDVPFVREGQRQHERTAPIATWCEKNQEPTQTKTSLPATGKIQKKGQARNLLLGVIAGSTFVV